MRSAWQLLADGLLIQRLHLHLEEWHGVVREVEELPDIGGVSVAGLARPPAVLPSPEARALLERAGLTFWWSLPQQHGVDGDTSATCLARAVAQVRMRLIPDGTAAPWAEAAVVAVEASAWWVGFFALIRHRGVRPLTLEPNPYPIQAPVLEGAVRAVSYGLATRLLAAALQARDDEPARHSYCEAITASLEVERGIPALLSDLDELRLVDLVTTAAVWRGQFTKYAGGTGAGQVE
ncbi:hypothetical protein [Actinomadura harenae]|uniref:Uncharacterized protein n=1 Tax=Actinomadura harenae TaxID=2483351 RepID=A0A3M2LN41_9ACTN|nr:hypothetical protein [Actinomadura harenae]RMI37505.1 hypothetical protein EBO15_35675 [Actinomadura harenae]